MYCTLLVYVVDFSNFTAGNLALSRALGDFAFKRNEDRRPEDQIITGVCCLKCSSLKSITRMFLIVNLNFGIVCFPIAACPDVIVNDITDDFEFIIMACDGIKLLDSLSLLFILWHASFLFRIYSCYCSNITLEVYS